MMGWWPIGTRGFGRSSEYSRRRVPIPPQNRTTFMVVSFDESRACASRRSVDRAARAGLRAWLEGERGELLGAEHVAVTAGRELDVLHRDRLVLRDVLEQPRAFGEAHGEQVVREEGVGVVDDAVAHEATDAVEDLARLEITLGDGADLGHGSADGRGGRIANQRGARNRRGDLDVGEVV